MNAANIFGGNVDPWYSFVDSQVAMLHQLIGSLCSCHQEMVTVVINLHDSRTVAFLHGSINFINDTWSMLCDVAHQHGGPEELALLATLDQYTLQWRQAEAYFIRVIDAWTMATS